MSDSAVWCVPSLTMQYSQVRCHPAAGSNRDRCASGALTICCLVRAQVALAIQGSSLAEGFVLPNLMRFLNAESAYLSNTQGGPRMFVNLEDDLSGSTDSVNARFQARCALGLALKAQLICPSWFRARLYHLL